MLSKLKEFFYPGIISLDVSPIDGTLLFYDRANAVCPPFATILDYGAGSGDSIKNMPNFKQNLALFKPNVSSRIGVDVEEDVLSNLYLDKAYLLKKENGFQMPIEGDSIDLVVSDWVIEHLPFPEESFKDIFRVLKPGGWFCARTVNIYHYAFAIANLVKNSSLERHLLNVTQGERHTWPKSYLSNTHNKLFKKVHKAGFENITIVPWEPEPAYLMKHPISLLIGVTWQKLASIGILPKATLMVYAQKSPLKK